MSDTNWKPQTKVTAGVATGTLGVIAAWIIETWGGVQVPAVVALAIDTALVGLVQYAIRNQQTSA